MGAFEAHVDKLLSTLKVRHRADHEAYLEKLQTETEPRKVKWSAQLLNLRKIQDTLVKQKKYLEAKELKAQLVEMEEKERALWKAKRDTKIAALEHRFSEKQSLEMGGFLKRVESGRMEQKFTRDHEMERLLQRYQNVKMQLSYSQKTSQRPVDQPASPQRHHSPRQNRSPSRKNQSPLRCQSPPRHQLPLYSEKQHYLEPLRHRSPHPH